MLSDRFGGKLILSLSVLLTSIGNAVIPYALKYGELKNNLIIQICSNSFFLGELKVLILLRILMGLVGGATFPALIVLLAAWVPERERGKLGTLALSGSQVRFDVFKFRLDVTQISSNFSQFCRLVILYRFTYRD